MDLGMKFDTHWQLVFIFKATIPNTTKITANNVFI